MRKEYAIRMISSDDYIRELSEYTMDNSSRIKTFESYHDAKAYIMLNGLSETDVLIEEV